MYWYKALGLTITPEVVTSRAAGVTYILLVYMGY